MPELSPIARFFAATDALLERVEPTWWGAVVTDSRFPDVYDSNYARVDGAQPDLTVGDVEQSLIPALRSSGAIHFHVVVFEPNGCPRLLDDFQRAGYTLSWDTVMEYRGSAPVEPASHRVEEIEPEAEELSWLQDRLFREFGVADDKARRQLVAWARGVLGPGGRRWFAVRHEGGVAGMGSVQVRAGVGYLDDVLTMPDFRRRGVASAMVRRLVQEARAASAAHVLLLTDLDDAARLYRTLGFQEVGRVASVLSRLDPNPQPKGSSGSVGSGTVAPGEAAGAGSAQGAGAG